jgi:hypothetical protein
VTPEEIDTLWRNRDRVAEANDRAAARAKFFADREIGCLSGRAWMYIQGLKPPLDPIEANLPVACGRKDTQRFISWTDVERLLEAGEPMLFEVTCPDCFKLWDTFMRAKWDEPPKWTPKALTK